MRDNYKKVLFALISTMSVVATPSVQAVNVTDDGNNKAVGHVRWHASANIDPMDLINQNMPSDTTSLFFIRRYDEDPEQLSANIAVNDRFQVSLHPGNYTQVYSCAGINRLSAEPTMLKTNNLLLEAYPYEFKGGEHYFFYVDVDAQGQTEIQQITKSSALEVLNNRNHQTHQISRVVPNCPPIEPKPSLPVVVVTPLPPVVQQPMIEVAPAPVLREKVSMEVEVLFDNDKSVIKPQYFGEVQEVADFMKTYPNTMAVIEGHTDSNASDSYNQKLSERRAHAVMEMLIVQYGIDPSRLTAVGYGEARPRASNATAAGRQSNRRVMAVIEER